MRPGGGSRIIGQQAAVHRATQHALLSSQTARSRIISPPRSAIAEITRALIEAPPTDDELRLLIEVTEDAKANDLAPEQVEARLAGTRLLQLLVLLKQNDVRVLTYLM